MAELTGWIEQHTPTWFAKAGDPAEQIFGRTVASLVVVLGIFMVIGALLSAL